MSADEDVPPLEDMSDLIQQVDALRELKLKQQTRSQTQSKISQNGHKDSSKIEGKNSEPKKMENTKMIEESQIQKSEISNNTIPINSGTSTNKTVQKTNSSSSFGGMKKGFLFGGASKSKSSQETNSNSTNKTHACGNDSKQSKVGGNKTLEDIPFLKKNEGKKSEELRFSEVQEAMEKTNSQLMENKEWVTDDLLNNIEKNEKLTKRLQDPKFIQAIGEFQKDPNEALKKYGDNPEVQEFFKDFCGLMGEHFNKLGDKQGTSEQSSLPSQPKVVTGSGADMQVRSSTNPNQPTAADEAKMQQILADPEIRDILVDPQIQSLFECLRNDPAKGQRILQTASGELRAKIHRLVQAGLLQFQQS